MHKYFSVLVAILALPLVFDARADEHAGRGGWGAFESVFRVQCRIINQKDKERADLDVGTAFGHKSGNVLSANHVVDGCLKASGSLRLLSAEGTDSPATVVSQDAVLDLALLKPNEGFVKNPIPIEAKDTMAMGSQVSSWGFPIGYAEKVPLLTVGYLAGMSPDPLNSSVRRWVVNAAINKGNSGGPLLETATPAVIGVVIMKYSPLNRSLKSKLENISKSGGTEAQVFAQALIDIGERAQLVIALSVMTTDLRDFLRKAGVEP